MSRFYRKCILPFSIAGIIFILSATCFSQEKAREKAWPYSQEAVTVKGNADKLEISTKNTRPDVLELLEPQTMITLNLALMEIKKTSTETLATSVIKVRNGYPGSFIMAKSIAHIGEKISITPPAQQMTITPHIIEGKHIELRMKYLFEPQMKTWGDAVFQVSNSETVLLPLFINQAENSKLSIKLTPLIETNGPLSVFPGPLLSLRLIGSVLLMNNEVLLANGTLTAESDKNDIDLFFFANGKGLYALSFKPIEGGEIRGVASGNVIRMKCGEDYFEWICREPILPEGKWPVWIRHNPRFDPSIASRSGTLAPTKYGFAGIATSWEQLKKYF
jgi:hypothetical protein